MKRIRRNENDHIKKTEKRRLREGAGVQEGVLRPGVVTDTYFAVNETGRIAGIVDLRHELKGFLLDFGNSGYSVRPSERRIG